MIVLYDPRRHLYRRTHDGRVVPSVTTVLTWAGQIPERSRQRYAAPYLERGRRVHRATAAADTPTFTDDPGSLLMPGEDGWLQAWRACCRRLRPRFDCIEAIGHLDGLVAGTVDRGGFLEGLSGEPYAVLDLKTGDKRPWHRYQLAGYVAIRRLPPTTLRLGIHLCQDGTFSTQPYTEPRDVRVFLTWVKEWWDANDDSDEEAGTLSDD